MYRIYFGMEDCFSEIVNSLVFFEQQYYFLETVESIAVLSFADFVAGVGDDDDDGADAVSFVVGCEFLSTEGF